MHHASRVEAVIPDFKPAGRPVGPGEAPPGIVAPRPHHAPAHLASHRCRAADVRRCRRCLLLLPVATDRSADRGRPARQRGRADCPGDRRAVEGEPRQRATAANVVEGPAAAAEAIDKGEADLAVVRRDVAMPKDGQVVAILRKNVVAFIVPAHQPQPPRRARRPRPRPRPRTRSTRSKAWSAGGSA